MQHKILTRIPALSVTALVLAQIATAQINVDVGTARITATYGGQPLSEIGAACSLRGRIPGFVSLCNPVTVTLAAGVQTLQLINENLGPVGAPINFTITPGAETPVTVEVSGLMGLLSGSLTINGGAPPSGTQVLVNSSNNFVRANVGSNGLFKLLVFPGPGTARVSVSGGEVGTFPYEAFAGVNVDAGHFAFGNGTARITATYGGQPLSEIGASCSLRGRTPGFVSLCNPVTVTLAAGVQTLQLINEQNGYVGGPINFTITPGAETPVTVEVSGLMGLLSGSLTINGGAPPSGTQVLVNSNSNFVRANVGSNGLFKLLVFPGPGIARVSVSGTEVGTFPYEAFAGVNVDAGHFAFGNGTAEITATYGGQPISETGASCSLWGRIGGRLVTGLCGPSTVTLPAGVHALQLLTETLSPIGAPISVTITPGAVTAVTAEVSSLMGLLSGSLTVNGGAPPSGTQILVNSSPNFVRANVGSNGLFKLLVVAGPGIARVSVSSSEVGTFSFEAFAGTTTQVGVPVGNTPVGSNVNVTATNPDGSASPVGLKFDNVTQTGTTTLATTSTGPPGGPSTPLEFKSGSPATYFNITTTAQFNGTVQVCVNYSAMSFSGPEGNLRLFHFKNDVWTDITVSIDTGTNTLCGVTPSFSFFAVFEPVNVAPRIDGITGPAPLPLGTRVDLVVNFSDTGVLDSHTCSFSWGDSLSPTTTVVGGIPPGTRQCTGSFFFNGAGVYAVTVTVRDDKGGSDQQTYQYVVVYDPSGGFVTGGGWILSPAGAYAANPSLTGKANFGFVARYQKGANQPSGDTEFQFKAGDLTFKSSSYDWLVVAGARAQFKGSGTINGQGDYQFLLTAIDGQGPGGGGSDKFRIKITSKNGGGIVYDNAPGRADTADPPTELGGGAITIHN